MVKFSKELEAQLIPEWKDAFVNYWELKKHVKRIKLAGNTKRVHDMNYGFGRSIFDSIRSFLHRISGRPNPEIIQVKSKISVGEDGEVENNETELVQLFSEEDEVKMFFEAIDEELNKVNLFHRNKEAEFLERGDLLKKQLQTLLDLKQVLTDRRRRNRPPKSPSHFDQNSDYSETQSECCDTPIHSQINEDDLDDEVVSTLERNGINIVNSSARAKMKKRRPKIALKIDIPITTPTRTIVAVTSALWEDLVNTPSNKGSGNNLNRRKIQCAEKMIRGAFVELYRGLCLLKTYSSLNMVAFTKILKKFDKVSNQHASTSFLQVVKRSHFMSSDKVVRQMDEVESIFTEHFTNNDRKKTMKFLRPHHHKDSHILTFFVGLFTGCFIILFAAYAILAHLSGRLSSQAQAPYIETIYPVFSMFALLSLHLFMYGCNLYMWRKTRINYIFIFEFQPKTALKYRDAFLICTSLMTAVVGAMIIHLILLSKHFWPHRVDLIPGILLLLFFLLLICPMNIFYRPTRYYFIGVIRSIVFSPFYKVLMVDFFMADQLTSQIPLLRHMESAACYFLAGSFNTHHYNTCKSGKLYMELAYAISFAPYYWRAMQCGRRWFDEGDINHIANLGKYLSAMVAAGARLTYARQPTQLWMIIVLVTSLIATVYQLYWDFVKDWGFFNLKSKNPFLRDDLALKNKGVYYGSIVLNVILRVAWVETVMRFDIGMFETRLLDFFLASLEVIRRGHWNYYRLENEHLNNVGKFRAVKTIPLPFRDSDSDG